MRIASDTMLAREKQGEKGAKPLVKGGVVRGYWRVKPLKAAAPAPQERKRELPSLLEH